jgi:hypothetical protein
MTMAIRLSAVKAFGFLLAQMLFWSNLSAAEVDSAIELDHSVLSPQGYRSATITIKSELSVSLSESAQCAKSSKFGAAEKLPAAGVYRVVVEAANLAQGPNQVFICFDKAEGAMAEPKQLTLVRDDAVPQVTFAPIAGEYGALPEIRIESQGAVVTVYTIDGAEPDFAADGTVKSGIVYAGAYKPSGNNILIKARAISAAGVVSQPVAAAYNINDRLAFSAAWDIYAGGLYLNTVGPVKEYLPSGIGGIIGIRRGLDDILAPNLSDIYARAFWLPGAWAEAQYLRYENQPYSEAALALIAGPEWHIALTRTRSVLFTIALGAGASHISVSTPAYSGSGITGTLQVKSGVEYHFHSWAVFAHLRYAHFLDQSSPLMGVGLSGGVYYKI